MKRVVKASYSTIDGHYPEVNKVLEDLKDVNVDDRTILHHFFDYLDRKTLVEVLEDLYKEVTEGDADEEVY